MDAVAIINHIKSLCNNKQWSYYKLAKQSHIPYSSLNTMLKHEHMPSLYTLDKICAGLGITLSQFFAGIDNTTNDTPQELISLWNSLDVNSRTLALTYMYGLAHKHIGDWR